MERIVQKLNSPLLRRKSVSDKVRNFGIPIRCLLNNNVDNIPRIVSNICDFLLEYGVNTEGIFRINGNSKTISNLKAFFDINSAENLTKPDYHDVHAICGTFKLFLREIPDGLISESATRHIVKVMDRLKEDKPRCIKKLVEILSTLPPENHALLAYICRFLRQFVVNEPITKMSASNMGIVFGPCVFRCGLGIQGLRQQSLSNLAMTYLIVFYDEVFSCPLQLGTDSDCSEIDQKTLATSRLSSLQPLASNAHSSETRQPFSRPSRVHLSIDQLPGCHETRVVSPSAPSSSSLSAGIVSRSSKSRPVTPRNDAPASQTHAQSTNSLLDAALVWSQRWRNSGIQSPSTQISPSAECPLICSSSIGWRQVASKSRESLCPQSGSLSNISEADSLSSHGVLARELASIMTSISMPNATGDSLCSPETDHNAEQNNSISRDLRGKILPPDVGIATMCKATSLSSSSSSSSPSANPFSSVVVTNMGNRGEFRGVSGTAASMPSLCLSAKAKANVVDYHNIGKEANNDDDEVWHLLRRGQSPDPLFPRHSSSNSISSLDQRIGNNDQPPCPSHDPVKAASEIHTIIANSEKTFRAVSPYNEKTLVVPEWLTSFDHGTYPVETDTLILGDSRLRPNIITQSADRAVSHFFPHSPHGLNPHPDNRTRSHEINDTRMIAGFCRIANDYSSDTKQEFVQQIKDSSACIQNNSKTGSDIYRIDVAIENAPELTQEQPNFFSNLPSPEIAESRVVDNAADFFESDTVQPKVFSGPLCPTKLTRIATWPRKRNILSNIQNRLSLDMSYPHDMTKSARRDSILIKTDDLRYSAKTGSHGKGFIDDSFYDGNPGASETAAKIRILGELAESQNPDIGSFPSKSIAFPNPSSSSSSPSDLEVFYNLLLAVLAEQRDRCGRSDVIEELSPEQLVQEKSDLQKSLLYFERAHGRPQESSGKRIMKPLYDRYRHVRRLVRASQHFVPQNRSLTATSSEPPGYCQPCCTAVDVVPQIELLVPDGNTSETPLITLSTGVSSSILLQDSQSIGDEDDDCGLETTVSEATVTTGISVATLQPGSPSDVRLLDKNTVDSSCSDVFQTPASDQISCNDALESIDALLEPGLSIYNFTACLKSLPMEQLTRIHHALLTSKHRVQRKLHNFEEQIQLVTQRPPSKQDRDQLRGDYTRYRDLKQRVFVLDRLFESPLLGLDELVTMTQSVGRCHRRKRDSGNCSAKSFVSSFSLSALTTAHSAVAKNQFVDTASDLVSSQAPVPRVEPNASINPSLFD